DAVAAAAQAREQPAGAAVVAAGADGRVVEALADPTLVRGALGAQLAHAALLAGRQEHVRDLPRQERPAAHVAVDDGRIRADRLACHGVIPWGDTRRPRVAVGPPPAAW